MMQQQHGRQPGPQSQPGVIPPGSQAQMQGMPMGQIGTQPGQNISIDDFNFEFQDDFVPRIEMYGERRVWKTGVVKGIKWVVLVSKEDGRG